MRALGVLWLGVLTIAGVGYLLSPLDSLRTAVLLVVIAAWLVVFTRMCQRTWAGGGHVHRGSPSGGA